MAGIDWLLYWNEVTDSACDVTFERNNCGEPAEDFVSAAEWLEHLCQLGYWSNGHWECPRAEGTAIRLVPARPEYTVGENLSFETIVSAEQDLSGTLILRVLLDDSRSAMWPDFVLAEYTHSVELAAGETNEFADHFVIPDDLLTSHELLLEARVGEEDGYYALVPIRVKPSFEWNLDLDEPTADEPNRVLVLTVRNVAGKEIQDIAVRLDAPLGIEVELPTQKYDSIAPGGSHQFSWVLPEEGPIDSAAATLTIESEDAGSVRITKDLNVHK
jgi:hypothetical protein